MSIMMLVMLISFLGALFGVGMVGFMLGRRQLPPPAAATEDRRLAEQAERIELLEDELRRVQEQADFTERLLTERSDTLPEDAPD